MSEITELYENVGIKKLLYCDICKAQEHALGLCAETKCEPFYPPFTTEKQLELIKWLAIRFNSDYMSYWHNEIKDVWIFRLHDLTEFSSEEPYIYEGRNKDFTEALCNLINDLWQDLTPEEKQQVKGILE